MSRTQVFAAAVVALFAAGCSGEDAVAPSNDQASTPDLVARNDADAGPGGVATMTNAAAGNAVVAYPRNPDGTLGDPAYYPTGGLGSGGGLGNQGAMAVSHDRQFVYVVNAGSNDITVFKVVGNTLNVIQRIGSAGIEPISVALRGGLLYVLNDGGTAGIAGFYVRRDGTLSPVPGGTAALSTAVPNAAQVGFGPGRTLVVTEKATNRILVFPLDFRGRPGAPEITESSGATPFGFEVSPSGVLVVSEAFGGAPDGSAVSSYRFLRTSLTAVSPSVATTETAACWLLITPDGRFAYTTNTASGTVTGYRIRPNGALERLDADGVTASTGAGPIDMAHAGGGRFVYTLNNSGSISGFRRGPGGSLDPIGTTTGIPASANGLLAF